jgi:RimJ/RimL family protein N-acetyltransferase
MFLRTPRLLLRPPWPDDADALVHAVREEEGLGMAWPAALGRPEEFALADLPAEESRLLMFRRRRAGPLLVGAARLSGRPGGDNELGLWIARSRAGMGLAGEALRALVDSARLTLRARRLLLIQAGRWRPARRPPEPGIEVMMPAGW